MGNKGNIVCRSTGKTIRTPMFFHCFFVIGFKRRHLFAQPQTWAPPRCWRQRGRWNHPPPSQPRWNRLSQTTVKKRWFPWGIDDFMGFNGDWKRWCPLDFKGATVKNDANNGDLTWFKPAKLCGVGLLSWFTSLIFHCWIYGRRIERVNGVNMFTKCDVFVLGAIPKTYDYPLVNIQKAMEAMAHRNILLTYLKWWFSIAMLNYQRASRFGSSVSSVCFCFLCF